MQCISALLEKAKKGMIIHGEKKTMLTKILNEIVEFSQLERIIHLLRILRILESSSKHETISPGYTNRHLGNISDMQRLDKIYSYVLTNYPNEISWEKIAAIAHLSVSSFCRYFKIMTHKTFF